MRNFKEEEFIMGNEIVFCKMDAIFLVLLDELRDRVARPLTINSSYRSVDYNESINGASKSQHLYGKAVDIHCVDSALRLAIVGHAVQLGLSVGVGNTFIHIDNRDTQIMFVY